jgi:hypothetical protein
MKLFAIGVVAALTIGPVPPRRPAPLPPRAICIAPHFVDTDTSSPDVPPCRSGRYGVTIDSGAAVDWPRTESVKIEGLDAKALHRVVVQCNGKPHQSFRFRFTQFKSPTPCLFLNDFYKTAQLWEARRAPWCSCQ